MSEIQKGIFVAGGVLCLTLALIGIFIPVLPTTPFLLLAAFLFARSSSRALHWLENNRLFGAYLRNYREGRGMKLREKIFTLFMLWLTISLSILYITENRWVQLMLLGIALGVTIHLVRLNTYGPEA